MVLCFSALATSTFLFSILDVLVKLFFAYGFDPILLWEGLDNLKKARAKELKRKRSWFIRTQFE